MSNHFFAKKVSATVAVFACVLCLLGVATPTAAQVQTAVEYGFYSYWDDCYYLGGTFQLVCPYSSYFVTSFPDEIAELDTGAYDSVGGQFVWQRTGETFNVWSGPENGALATCRFFNALNATSFPEHFYTPYPAECAALRANAQSNYQYEGIAFYVQVPDSNGNCPIGTTILYRLYSGNSGTPVHRLTTSAATFNEMLAADFVFEGDARTFAFACVPSSAAPPTS